MNTVQIINLILMGLLFLLVVVGMPVFAIWFFHLAAKNKKQASYVLENTIEYVVAGETLVKTLFNAKNYRFYDLDNSMDFPVVVGRELSDTDPNAWREWEDPLEEKTPNGETVKKPKVIRVRRWKPEPIKIGVNHAIVDKQTIRDEIKRLQGGSSESDDSSRIRHLRLILAEGPFGPKTLRELRRSIMDQKTEGCSFKELSKNYLRLRWGFFWVSWFYPQTHIKWIEIIHKRLKTGRELVSAGLARNRPASLADQFDRVEKLPSPFLMWKFPRPILVSDVEFADQLRADLLVQAVFQVVIPYIPVFVLKDKLHEILESAVMGAVIDYARTIRYNDFVKTTKTGMGSDFFLKAISQVNLRTEIQAPSTPNALRLAKEGDGLVEKFGVAVIDGWLEDYQQMESEAQKALEAQELNRLRGEAEITRQTKLGQAGLAKAGLDAQAITLVGNARAGVLGAQVKAAGADVVKQQLQTDGLIGTRVGTVVFGGNAGIMVGATPGTARPNPPEPTDTNDGETPPDETENPAVTPPPTPPQNP